MNRTQPPRPARFLTLFLSSVALVAVLGACTIETKEKSEAADELAVVAEEMVESLTEAEVGPIEFAEFIDNRCHDEELDLYQVVMQFTIEVGPESPRYLITQIHRHWVNELEYFDRESGLVEGRSGMLRVDTSHESYRYRATLQPDRESITISVASNCYENPDDNPWIDEVEVPVPTEEEEE